MADRTRVMPENVEGPIVVVDTTCIDCALPPGCAHRLPNHYGEQKENSAILLRVKQCRVSFRDSDGIEHAVDLEARTLNEAVGLAIEHFRRCEQRQV
jgi:hypothetical protein